MSDSGEGDGDGERGSPGDRSEGERETEGVNFSLGKTIFDLLPLRVNKGDFGNELILFCASLATVAELEQVSVVMVAFVIVSVSVPLSSSSSSVKAVGSLIVIHSCVYFLLRGWPKDNTSMKTFKLLVLDLETYTQIIIVIVTDQVMTRVH